jgi:sulfur relay (sulfurtransferase) complex TusBCD TusD component (DsrE family)
LLIKDNIKHYVVTFVNFHCSGFDLKFCFIINGQVEPRANLAFTLRMANALLSQNHQLGFVGLQCHAAKLACPLWQAQHPTNATLAHDWQTLVNAHGTELMVCSAAVEQFNLSLSANWPIGGLMKSVQQTLTADRIWVF